MLSISGKILNIYKLYTYGLTRAGQGSRTFEKISKKLLKFWAGRRIIKKSFFEFFISFTYLRELPMCTQIIIIIFEDIDRVIHNIEITQAKLGEGQQFFLQVFLKFPDFIFIFANIVNYGPVENYFSKGRDCSIRPQVQHSVVSMIFFQKGLLGGQNSLVHLHVLKFYVNDIFKEFLSMVGRPIRNQKQSFTSRGRKMVSVPFIVLTFIAI